MNSNIIFASATAAIIIVSLLYYNHGGFVGHTTESVVIDAGWFYAEGYGPMPFAPYVVLAVPSDGGWYYDRYQCYNCIPDDVDLVIEYSPELGYYVVLVDRMPGFGEIDRRALSLIAWDVQRGQYVKLEAHNAYLDWINNGTLQVNVPR